jgi:Zn-finger nucleic acid-binding protein
MAASRAACKNISNVNTSTMEVEMEKPMKCPLCKLHTFSNVSLDSGLKAKVCKRCEGYWIALADYETWLKKDRIEETHGFSEFSDDIHDSVDAKLCSDCSRILTKYKVGHGLDFYVEHCSDCGGIWLDKHEWEALKAKGLSDDITRMFSTQWQKAVRDEKKALTMEKVYTDRFGSEGYKKAKDFKAWLNSRHDRTALLSYIMDEDN